MSIDPFNGNIQWLGSARQQFESVSKTPIREAFGPDGLAAFNREFNKQMEDLGMAPALACTAKDLPKLSVLASVDGISSGVNGSAKGQAPVKTR